MDDSQEHMNNSCIRNKSAVAADKSTPEKAKISPLGKSRYGRTRKPKISQDFCDIDDAIDDNSDEQFVKPPKMPKTPNKLRGGHTNINGVHTSLKDIINKPKHRNFHHNNNMEIVHITGDSDVNDMYMYKPKEKVQELPQKFSKMFVEKPKLPVAKNISVTKEKIPDIKDKKLSEQLKPILSEDIFQSPPINVAEVFKIISNKPNEVELETTAKQNSKMVKTYTNKRKSFQRSTTLIESFALPDEPIVPINEDEYIKPMRISEIDVDIVKPESVNLIDRELIDSLWKIGAAENNCCCHDNDISNVPVFDIRSRFTPEKDLYDENKDVIENKDDLKSISIIDSVKNQSKDKILKSNTEENVISTPKLKVEKIENEKKEEKHIIIKRIINKNMDIDNENSFAKIPESPTSIKKEKDMFIGKSPKKGICELIYERDDRVIKKENKASIDIGDIEEHIKISLIDKAKKKEILEEKQKEIYKGGIDINKLKNQINLRMEETMVGTKSDVHNGEEIKKVKDGIVPITDLPIVEEFVKGIPIADGCIVNVPTVEVLIPEVVEDSVVEVPITETVISDVEVPMTKDFEKLDLTTADNKKGTHKPGDLMWAKVGRYPYWPCLIINDPETKEYVMNRYRYHVYHVRFFGDNGRRSWIPIRHLLPYDTDLTTVVKENKNEIVIPHKSTKSYKQWLVGCEEADSLKEKTKKEKFQFFRKIFSKKKHLPKKSQERGVVKLSNRVRMKPEQIKKKTIQKKIIQPTGTDKLRMEILENLADILTTTEFRRTTRSSRRNSMKSHTTVGSKNEMDDIEADDDSKKHDSSSYCSEDELNNRKFFPLTVESQIALYKRNNLFKGVSKDRVCQICDKPDGIVKCKGRCSGYYHVSCASRKENSDLSENHSITDISFDTTQSQPGTPSGENQSEKEVNRDQKINGSIKEVSIKPSEVTSQPEDSGNSNLRNKDDKHAALRTRRKSRTSPVDSDDTQIERIGDKNEFKEEQKPTRRSPRKSRIYDTNIPRRITRSQSQERELVPRQAFENKPRRARSQRNSVSENLEEIDMTSMVCDKIKDEIRSDKKICEISLYDIKGLNDLKDWNKGIESEIFVKNIENCINDTDRKKIKRALNPDVTHQKDDAKGEEESKSDDAQIVLKDVKEDTNDQARKKQECNVKIVHIKDRKKTGTSPKLTLNQDSEFGKLPLLDQIDHKMQEVMQKVDKKHLYADSTTDYTSSEESAVDLLSPKGKKLIVNSLSQNISTNKVVLEEETAGNLIETTDKKVQVKTSKQNKNEQQQSEIDFKCADCLEDIDHPCFVCHKYVSRKGSSIRQKCSIFPCGKFYHPDCLKVWPQTQWSVISTTKHKQSNTNLDTFVCPVHVCHTCVSDDPRAAIPRCTSDKVAKCLRCPATYHNSAHCIPAGTEILSFTQIICPRHLMKTQKRALPIINTTWCFICSEGGDLICCETCPTSVHLECLKINLAEDDNFICEDCETGRFPLYDEIVWVKLGNYRWWPGIILFPNEIPEKIKSVKHIRGEFVVKFFGTYDHYWVGRGRVFLFQEGDSGEAPGSSRKKTDAVFKKSIQEATEAHRIKREFKQAIIDEAAIKSKHKPPPYIKIKMNRPVGNVRQFDGNISNTTPCECKPNSQNPCGADSDCLNRLLLTECNPDVCPAGEKCQNQNFEKRTYPPLVPYKTEGRGWGLKSLEKIAKGQFVIEYVGEMIDEQEYQRRIKKMHEQKEENYYFLTIDKDRMLDAGPKGNVARFMNHSCQPNCETQKWTVNGDTRVGLFAVDDIPNNTELTFNYNLECVGKEKKMCKCGAPNCSGFIGVKVKPEEQPKRLKSKLKHRRKKSSPLPEPANKKPCFVCGENGDVFLCNNKICTKSYHPRCVNLDSWPDNKWACPWHNCNICTKRTIRCCVKCLNSYCPVHSDGNIRYDKLLGFICLEHDPNKADLQENKIEKKSQKDLKTSTPPKPTEESDVTSTTSEEQDQIVPERQIAERQMTPKHLSDNEEIVTSTPIKSGHDDKEIATTVEETVAEIVAEVPVLKRKRGRPRKDETIANRKLKKLKFNEMREKDGENEEFNKVARKLRTPKPVNYGGVSGKVNVARKRFHLSLRSTSKRKARV